MGLSAKVSCRGTRDSISRVSNYPELDSLDEGRSLLVRTMPGVEAFVASAGNDPVACVCSVVFGFLLALAYYVCHHRQKVLMANMPNVAFMTDVEGNWEYFIKCIEMSPVLELLSLHEDGSADIKLQPGWHFVFGGDSVDKGGKVGGSIRVATTLVRLKKKYPSAVHIILGNRDINKMRFTSELAPSQLAELHGVPGPYWVAPAKRVSPEGFLRATIAKSRGIQPEEVDEAALHVANTPAARVRWMLKETMGADGEFERRRAELSVIHKIDVSKVRLVLGVPNTHVGECRETPFTAVCSPLPTHPTPPIHTHPTPPGERKRRRELFRRQRRPRRRDARAGASRGAHSRPSG